MHNFTASSLPTGSLFDYKYIFTYTFTITLLLQFLMRLISISEMNRTEPDFKVILHVT